MSNEFTKKLIDQLKSGQNTLRTVESLRPPSYKDAQDTPMRKKLSYWTLGIIILELFSIHGLVYLMAFGHCWLEKEIVYTFFASTIANTYALLALSFKYYFKQQ